MLENSRMLLDKRYYIMRVIDTMPGIRYSELQKIICMPNGVLSFYIQSLEKANTIKVRRQARVTRLFPNWVGNDEIEIISLLREDTRLAIVKKLLENPSTYKELLSMDRSPSTLSWHLNRLLEARIVKVTFRNRVKVYEISDTGFVNKVIDKYFNTFTNIIDIWR